MRKQEEQVSGFEGTIFSMNLKTPDFESQVADSEFKGQVLGDRGRERESGTFENRAWAAESGGWREQKTCSDVTKQQAERPFCPTEQKGQVVIKSVNKSEEAACRKPGTTVKI